ncbi:hypothetical protein F994_03144 [Acinetobacter bohemicus ANC 3994]|uniref:Uncharacterized protein n=1 Tax=Acinetobacter bohemicus ANC 3994 TaxID=1217715 RepID=N8NVX1_9GAMM|nr:SEL1-like repeat protein [Acinetobacter bohemicus]ENU18330.1 hypothetical protein F994_03144 [Acinetobacter bohemicus ANC 3994]
MIIAKILILLIQTFGVIAIISLIISLITKLLSTLPFGSITAAKSTFKVFNHIKNYDNQVHEKKLINKNYANIQQNWKIQDLENLAENGDAVAQNKLGEIFFLGLNTPKNFAKSFKWSVIAAQNKHKESQQRLVTLYSNGWGVKRDLDIAKYWENQFLDIKTNLTRIGDNKLT